MYVQRRPQQLGILPAVLAIPAFLTSLNSALSHFGLNSSDPVKDQQRVARISRAFSLAMSGDTSAQSDLGGMNGETYLNYIASNVAVPGGGTSSGSAVAQRTAQAAVLELKARRAAGTVGTGLISVSDIPSQIGGILQRAITNPLVIGGVLLAGVFLLSRKGRR